MGLRTGESKTAAATAIRVTKVAPNLRSKEAAVAEAVAAGLSPEAAGDRPSLVDHSLSIHFPPIKHQMAGDCTCYSSTYYYNTFLQAQDEGLDARAVGGTGLGDPDVICSPRFVFLLIAEGSWGAVGTRTAMARLADSGSSSVTEFGYEENVWGPWPPETAWIQALRNRTGPLRSIQVDTPEGLEAMKQVIANGSCVVTRADFGANYGAYRDDASGYGIDSHVMYDRDMSGHGNIHSICICGYDDNKSYSDHRDKRTHKGAFIIANSEGPDNDWHNSSGTGTKGFMWVSYSMFLERQLGYYNWPWKEEPKWDPCWDNEDDPTVYYHEDRPHHRPRLFAVVGVNHSKRNTLILTGGIGEDPDSPEFQGPEAIKQTDFGEIAISDSRRVAVDLTDGVGLLRPGVPKQVYVKLTVADGAGSNGTITSADFHYDPDGDGVYSVISSTDPTVVVIPGRANSGCATVRITAPVTIYVDRDAAGNRVQDGTAAHPYKTIQAGINAATGPAVVKVLPGTYRESVEMASNITLLGSGADRTFIDSRGLTNSGGSGEAIFCSDVTRVAVDGFGLTTSDASDTALRSVNSTVTVQNCVATGSAGGFGVGQAGSATLVNCLSYGNVRGIWLSDAANLTVRNCTLVGNGEVGLLHKGTGSVTLVDSILWDNGDDLSAVAITVRHCDIGDGDHAGTEGNISQDPLFVTGPQHGYYLSQTAAGQGANSPCVDAGSTHAVTHGFTSKTTRTDEVNDSYKVDMGCHASRALRSMPIENAGPDA
ncbi:MAG: right-handed parallel beta-helix repeat-containing protein [Verrucomicrobia bacterium]|nr:right-handed parallel beta-helix repeat-containing protein [Verrucomicrobiota bacterium]